MERSTKDLWRSSRRYRAAIAAKRPSTALGIILLVFFAYAILAPVISLMFSAVQVAPGDSGKTGGNTGEFTSYYVDRVFSSQMSEIIFWEPLLNTLFLTVVTIAGALLVGVPLAFLVVRTDLPARKWFQTALIVPYMLPNWTFALAWLTIFKNRKVAGSIGWMENLGWTPPSWFAYGPLPISLIYILHLVPFVLLLTMNQIRNIPTELEDAARIFGSSQRTRVRKIVLPLLRPALISAATLISAKVVGEFGVAYVLGTPGDFKVLSTTLYQSLAIGDQGVAGVIAVVMVILGAASIFVDYRFLREMKRYTTVSGRAGGARTTKLGRWRWPAFVAVAIFFVVCVIMPLLILVLSTIMQVPGDFSFSNFTLDYWIGQDLHTVNFREGVLVNDRVWGAIRNTLLIVGIASVGSGVLGMMVGYVAVNTPWTWLGSSLRAITYTPYLVPGIAFAAAYISLFAVQRGPIPALYGTVGILILAMMMDEMPFASRAGVSSMMQLGKDAEEAGQMLGARWPQRMGKIVLPIQRSALASAILLPFISGVQSLSLVVVLVTPGTDMLTTLSINLVDAGYTHAGNAITVLICAVALIGTWVARKIFRADLSSGMGA